MITPSMAAISHIGHTSAVNMPVTKNRHPKPMGFRFLYMGKPPGIYYVIKPVFVTGTQGLVDNKKILCYTVGVRFMGHLLGYYYLRNR